MIPPNEMKELDFHEGWASDKEGPFKGTESLEGSNKQSTKDLVCPGRSQTAL